MKCKHCNADIIVGSRFCINCCAPIEYDSVTIKQFEEESFKKDRSKKRNKTIHKYVKFCLSLFSMCLVLTIGFFTFYDKSSNSFNTDTFTSVSEFITKPKESIEQKNQDTINDAKITSKRTPLEIGESISSKTYEILFEKVHIVDIDSESARYYSIRKGKEYVLIKLSIGNSTYNDTVISSLFNFVANIDDKEIVESFSGVLAEGYPSINGVNFRRSLKTGYICYYVEEGWKKINISVNIDGLENEPYLIVENPKNRIIGDEEISNIIEQCEIDNFMYTNGLNYVSKSDLARIITDFMHLNCISKGDIVPSEGLQKYILGNV